ncbi:cupredoxin domain-containing protein [Hyphomicrobium facile]|uniref:Cupredoxin-like domain-containing protein n=1 Tax=Hyphomicrobium facile TaxID=51670 RepID=A0A1I7MTE9_9HYPH|nr:cupredoxin domain-containing protein [Hyphomicrobium facile]SFV25670.1 Cupredoxin-like domain-containing protein [Hyphomicrobium facile]
MGTSFSSRIGARFRAFISALAVAAIAVGGAWIGASEVQAAEEHAIEISIKDHKFEPDSLKLPAGKPIKITVKNLDATPEEFESYELGFEKIIAGNSSAIIRLKPLKPGTYMFFGEFHQDSALGHIVVE